MKTLLNILLFVSYNLVLSQNNFKITLKAPDFEKDSLFIGPPMSSGNTHKIYNFEVVAEKNISFMKDFNSVKAKITPETIIKGNIEYPQPLSISYYDPKINGGYESKPFFIEKGNLDITVNKNNNIGLILNTEDKANKEYTILQEKLKRYNDILKPFQENDSKIIENKQIFLQNYIKNNPNSFVAFWEIVSDFSRFGFNKSYLNSLKLFSKNVRNTFSYIEFSKILNTENSTNVGGNFPEIQFENNSKISKADFSKYNLTLVDYWSTTCKPCIQDLPELVKMYEKYKEKGINFISVTDENQKDRIDLAKNILAKNQVTWTNYFDLRKEFPKKLNAAGYPLQILVDGNGKIIARKLGELEQIENEIEKYAK